MWKSLTLQFGAKEMDMIQAKSAAELLPMILDSDPVVALRVLAEIMLNNEEEKLNELLKSNELNAHWQAYNSDYGVIADDHNYAQQLKQRSEGLQNG